MLQEGQHLFTLLHLLLVDSWEQRTPANPMSVEEDMFAKAYNVADAGRMTFLFKANLDQAAPVEEGVICMRNLVAIMKY